MIAHHAVQGVEGAVGGGGRQSEQRKGQQRGNDAVGDVFGDGFNGGGGHLAGG